MVYQLAQTCDVPCCAAPVHCDRHKFAPSQSVIDVFLPAFAYFFSHVLGLTGCLDTVALRTFVAANIRQNGQS